MLPAEDLFACVYVLVDDAITGVCALVLVLAVALSGCSGSSVKPSSDHDPAAGRRPR